MIKRLSIPVVLLLVFVSVAYSVQIDISRARVDITGPLTMTINNVSAVGNHFWADLEWDPARNVFEVADFGLEPDCPSVVGEWSLYYDWLCDHDEEWMSITFYSDLTFTDGQGRSGTWEQDECNVDWWYDNGTFYWGLMEADGSYMDGEAINHLEEDGCWWAFSTPGVVSDGSPK